MATTAKARYEILLLAVPEIAADDAATIESQLHSAVTAQKGDILSFERWGKYRLAYQIRKNDYGVYYLSRFELPSKDLGLALEEVHKLFRIKYRDLVMRYMIAELPYEKSLEYSRPESLEEAPRRENSDERNGNGRRDRDDRRHSARPRFEREEEVRENVVADAPAEEVVVEEVVAEEAGE
ncbi:TPA: 30S ribosomal protein S6 [Candidatus Dependentiae bacterium]|nr:30S ribosomal protein S6 [Candidatus Dependentiae bacterium]